MISEQWGECLYEQYERQWLMSKMVDNDLAECLKSMPQDIFLNRNISINVNLVRSKNDHNSVSDAIKFAQNS